MAIVRDGYARQQKRPEIRERLRAAGFERSISAIGYIAQEMGVRQAAEVWSDEELLRLRELYVPGADAKEVAAALGRPLKGVHTKAHDLGLHLRQVWTDEEVQRLMDAQAQGRMLTEVAAELGRPYINVAQKARKLALDFRRPGKGKVVAPVLVAPPTPPAPVLGPWLLVLCAATVAARLQDAVTAAKAALAAKADRPARAAAPRQREARPAAPQPKPIVQDKPAQRPLRAVARPVEPVARRNPPLVAPRPAPEPVKPLPPAPVPPVPPRAPQLQVDVPPLRLPPRAPAVKTLGAKEAERRLIEEAAARFAASKGAAKVEDVVKHSVDFGPDQPAVEALRALSYQVFKGNPHKAPRNKLWCVSGWWCSTEQLWQRANEELTARHLPRIRRNADAQ